MGESGYTTVSLQYWYVILTLCIGLVSIIAFNLITFCYFSKRRPIDPVKLFTEIESDNEQEEIGKEIPIYREPTALASNEFDTDLAHIQPSTSSSSFDSKDLNNFRMEALATHNELREKHNAPPLQFSEDLSLSAQYWAENMAKENRLVHSPADWRLKFNSEPLGENVVLTNGFKLTGKGMSDMWYAESYKHNYHELQRDTKSFTQMIWSDTRKVGFGRAKSQDGKWYGCAHYYPEGNIIGLFRNNVFPLQQI